jgi:Mg2+ and Co2+ transporter CorA
VELHTAVLKVFKEDGDVYFEDLQYKFDKIMHTIQTVSENARSLSTTYNALANIQTNSVISLLTVFTASIGILAMITGLY